jgi:LAO/AO transport system kinase
MGFAPVITGLPIKDVFMQRRVAALTIEDYAAGVRAGDRAMLARAITLVESTKPEHAALAQRLLQALLPSTGEALRLGVTGVPGVGKSTTIDQLGMNLIAAGHRVAVLAVDPTSKRTGGSILGDKTRMSRLAQEPRAFIRPSPTSGTLGGVTRKTRETMELCEAAGFDVIIVETVGVGQSEVAVADMVDFFLVLLLAGGGDNVIRAERAAAEYRAALQILTPQSATWSPPVLTVSGRDNGGLDALWAKIAEHRSKMTATGEFAQRRQRQAVAWMSDMLNDRVMASLRANPRVAQRLPLLEEEVRAGRLVPTLAVDEILEMIGIATH